MQVCPGCGESSPDRFTECAFCGTPLAQRREAQEERKVLTVLFCDLKDSTALGEALDPEALGEVLDLYYTATTRVLRRHGASIQKFIGDAVVAAFGLPTLHEDDALRAVRAAVEMLEAVDRLNRQLQAAYGITIAVRIGVHTGEVVVRTAVNDQQVLTGDTLNTAARLEQGADAGEILVGGTTYALVRDAVEADALAPLELRGKAERVAAYRLRRVFGDEQASRRHDAPIVGRDAEQAELAELYARAVAERRCVLATVFGEAGVGKSRLVRSALDAVRGDALVLRGRCLPYGEGITFWPLLGIVRDACGITAEEPVEVARRRLDALGQDQEVSRRVASALGWSAEELPVAELFWGVREFLERLATQQPLVVVVDDVHWAAQTLLDLIDHLVEMVEDAPILVLATARPDMLDVHPEWSAGPHASRLVLDRLPDEVSEQVIANLLDGVQLPDEMRRQVVNAAEGNPLFVEQLVSMLIESGVLVATDGGWEAREALERLQIPPSIHALLAARLDNLTSEERAVVEPASVMGLEFPSEAISDLTPEPVSSTVGLQLDRLTEKQLVRPAAHFERQLDDHRFHHVLIRDAAYGRSLKRARADVHERFADWLEHHDRERGRAGEHDEIVGYHLEQAFGYRGQLGPVDPHQRVLGARAAEKLAGAGRRAFGRGDLPAAVSLLRRAIVVLSEEDPVRRALVPDLAEALTETGAFDRALAVLADVESTEDAADPEAARARLVHLLVDLYAGSDERWAERVNAEIARSEPIFTAAGHHGGMATASRLRYAVEGSALRFDAAADAAEQIIHHAEMAGDVRQQRRGALGYAIAALHGPTPVGEGIARCEELLQSIEGDRRTQAGIRLCLGPLLAMDGQIERGREVATSARAMFAEFGRSVLVSSTSIDTATVELMAGDLEAAELLLRRDDAELEALGETYLRSSVAGLLARVLALRGDMGPAERMVEVARELAASDDIDAEVLWRSARARILAATGRTSDARGLAEEAVAMASATTDPLRTAQALVDHAAVLLAAGDRMEAADALRHALALHVAKGDTVGAEMVRADLNRLGAEG